MLATIRTNSVKARLCPGFGPHSEAGYTLIELLVASLTAIVVLGGVTSALLSSQEVQAHDAEWALTMQEGRAGLSRMASEIRQATKVETAETGTISFLRPISGKNWQVKYECGVAQSGTTYDQCVRLTAEAGKSLPTSGTPVVREVINGTSVFAYSPSTTAPTVVTLKVELPAKGTLSQANSKGYSHHMVLEDAAFIRSLDLTG